MKIISNYQITFIIKIFLHEEAKIKGSNGQEWKVIETFDADKTKVKMDYKQSL